MVAALVVLCVALAGVGLACLCLYVAWGWALASVIVMLGCAAGWSLFAWGRQTVVRHPKQALKRMEWGMLLPGSLAAAGAGAVILLEIWLKTEDKGSWGNVVTAFSAALTTFVGALLVKGAESYDESWIAKPIKKAFEDQLSDEFDQNSKGEVALYNLEGDWGRSDRQERAKILERELRLKESREKVRRHRESGRSGGS